MVTVWKFNNSLVYDEVYVEKMKRNITKINNSNEFGKWKWEFLIKKIWKFTIDYSKTVSEKGKNRGLI